VSALYILGALTGRENGFHTLIDPNQSGKWKNIGTSNLTRAGFKNFELLETGSEFALPKLLQQEADFFDLIFIDGLHTFDQVMVDLYYANRLLRAGGYIVIDDCSWYTVAKALAYFVQYPAYKIAGQSEETSTLKKIGHFLISLLPWRAWYYLLPLKLFNLANRTRFSSMVALQKTTQDNRDGFWSVEF
jgi:predicted O-methyltransferase YrrM